MRLNCATDFSRNQKFTLINIGQIELTTKSFEKETGIKYISPLGEMEGHNVILHLKSEHKLQMLYGFKRKFNSIAFYID